MMVYHKVSLFEISRPRDTINNEVTARLSESMCHI